VAFYFGWFANSVHFNQINFFQTQLIHHFKVKILPVSQVFQIYDETLCIALFLLLKIAANKDPYAVK